MNVPLATVHHLYIIVSNTSNLLSGTLCSTFTRDVVLACVTRTTAARVAARWRVVARRARQTGAQRDTFIDVCACKIQVALKVITVLCMGSPTVC